jgi:hypothetical protein
MQRRAPACGRDWNHSDTLSKRNGTAAVPTWLSFHSICSILRRKEHRVFSLCDGIDITTAAPRHRRSSRRGHMDRRPVCQFESGEYRSSAAVNRPTTSSEILRVGDIGDKWDLVAQRPQLRGNSGSSGQRSCDGRRPSATRLSRGAIRAAMSVARTHPFALTRRAATNVCSPKSATTSRTPFPNAIPARSSILSVIGARNRARRSGASPSPLSAAVSSQAVAQAGGSPAC